MNEERFAQSILVDEIDDVAIFADRHGGVEAEAEVRISGRFNGAVGRRDGEPFGQGFDIELMAFAGGVGERNDLGYLVDVRLAIEVGYLQFALIPLEAVAIDECGPCDGRCHGVAVEVFDVAHGDEHGLFVDLAVCHIEVDEQFGIVVRPVEVHLGHLSAVAQRCIIGLVGALRRVTDDQRQFLIDHIAFGIFEDTPVIGAEDKFDDAVVVLFGDAERQVCHESHLIAGGRNRGVLLDERLGQRLLEEDELVYIAVEAAQ